MTRFTGFYLVLHGFTGFRLVLAAVVATRQRQHTKEAIEASPIARVSISRSEEKKQLFFCLPLARPSGHLEANGLSGHLLGIVHGRRVEIVTLIVDVMERVRL